MRSVWQNFLFNFIVVWCKTGIFWCSTPCIRISMQKRGIDPSLHCIGVMGVDWSPTWSVIKAFLRGLISSAHSHPRVYEWSARSCPICSDARTCLIWSDVKLFGFSPLRVATAFFLLEIDVENWSQELPRYGQKLVAHPTADHSVAGRWHCHHPLSLSANHLVCAEMMMTDQQGPARYGHKLLAHGTPISKLTIILLGSDNTLTILITILLDIKPSGVLSLWESQDSWTMPRLWAQVGDTPTTLPADHNIAWKWLCWYNIAINTLHHSQL